MPWAPRAPRRRLTLLLLSWLPVSGRATLLARSRDHFGEDVATGRVATPGKVQDFTGLFDALWSMDRRRDEPMSSRVQLAVGVFTIPLEQPHRKVVRRTWMNQTGVCPLKGGQAPNCSVYTAFIIGRSGIGRKRGTEQKWLAKHVEGDPREEQGMMVLNVTENMNEGKSFAYFLAIVKEYPWVTHVAKCDIDTYPALHKLVYRIEQQSLCEASPYVYAGKPVSCGERYMHDCEGFLRPDFPRACRKRLGCDGKVAPMSFNYGQFYLMSMALAKEIAVPGGIWENPPVFTHEDQVASLAVQNFSDASAARGESTCISLWDPDAWCHNIVCEAAERFNAF